MILLTTSDFDSGKYMIARTNDGDSLLQSYIDDHEKNFILRVLGVTLGQLFIDDVMGMDSDSSAIEQRFQDIIDPFTEQDSCNRILSSKGMKDILCALVFYEYISGTQAKHSQSGVIVNSAEVSNILIPENATRFAEQKWNAALCNIEAVQWYCDVFKDVGYTEYNGMRFHPKYSPLL